MALKKELDIKAGLFILEEFFIDKWKLVYNAFTFYWQYRNRIIIRVITVVKEMLFDKIVVEHKTNRINYLFLIFLKI